MTDRFTDQKRRVATAADLVAPWGGYRDGRRFRCYLCGHHFKEGDGYRWIYVCRAGCTNLIVCDACDGDDVVDRWVDRNAEFNSAKFWAFHENP